jgi:hypothetical protein
VGKESNNQGDEEKVQRSVGLLRRGRDLRSRNDKIRAKRARRENENGNQLLLSGHDQKKRKKGKKLAAVVVEKEVKMFNTWEVPIPTSGTSGGMHVPSGRLRQGACGHCGVRGVSGRGGNSEGANFQVAFPSLAGALGLGGYQREDVQG